jgi:hypothetical protein
MTWYIYVLNGVVRDYQRVGNEGESREDCVRRLLDFIIPHTAFSRVYSPAVGVYSNDYDGTPQTRDGILSTGYYFQWINPEHTEYEFWILS